MNDWPLINASEAASLEGKQWYVNDIWYTFGSISCGGEAYIAPIMDESSRVTSYLRILQSRFQTRERIHRTEWLIGQRLDLSCDVFRAAPCWWLSTYNAGRPKSCSFDFTGTCHQTIPGKSWREIKRASNLTGAHYCELPSRELRHSAAKSLIRNLAILESLQFIHGDPSDGNIMLDPETGCVTLIDFDAFVYRGSNTLKCPQLMVAQGGIRGTPGYCPPKLEQNPSSNAAPFSDRHARDMLLLELLGFQEGDPEDSSPHFWEDREVTLNEVRPYATAIGLPHLYHESVFYHDEDKRPSSRQLAAVLNLQVPLANSDREKGQISAPQALEAFNKPLQPAPRRIDAVTAPAKPRTRPSSRKQSPSSIQNRKPNIPPPPIRPTPAGIPKRSGWITFVMICLQVFSMVVLAPATLILGLLVFTPSPLGAKVVIIGLFCLALYLSAIICEAIKKNEEALR